MIPLMVPQMSCVQYIFFVMCHEAFNEGAQKKSYQRVEIMRLDMLLAAITFKSCKKLSLFFIVSLSELRGLDMRLMFFHLLPQSYA